MHIWGAEATRDSVFHQANSAAQFDHADGATQLLVLAGDDVHNGVDNLRGGILLEEEGLRGQHRVTHNVGGVEGTAEGVR